jgi:hypothetical protein
MVAVIWSFGGRYPMRELQSQLLRALVLLATIPDGVTEDLLVFAHGFDRAVIASLITEGFATARNILSPGRATIGVHIKISDVGRRALENL